MSTEFCLAAAHHAAAMLVVRGIAEKGRAAKFDGRLVGAMFGMLLQVGRHIPGRA